MFCHFALDTQKKLLNLAVSINTSIAFKNDATTTAFSDAIVTFCQQQQNSIYLSWSLSND